MSRKNKIFFISLFIYCTVATVAYFSSLLLTGLIAAILSFIAHGMLFLMMIGIIYLVIDIIEQEGR